MIALLYCYCFGLPQVLCGPTAQISSTLTRKRNPRSSQPARYPCHATTRSLNAPARQMGGNIRYVTPGVSTSTLLLSQHGNNWAAQTSADIHGFLRCWWLVGNRLVCVLRSRSGKIRTTIGVTNRLQKKINFVKPVNSKKKKGELE